MSLFVLQQAISRGKAEIAVSSGLIGQLAIRIPILDDKDRVISYTRVIFGDKPLDLLQAFTPQQLLLSADLEKALREAKLRIL